MRAHVEARRGRLADWRNVNSLKLKARNEWGARTWRRHCGSVTMTPLLALLPRGGRRVPSVGRSVGRSHLPAATGRALLCPLLHKTLEAKQRLYRRFTHWSALSVPLSLIAPRTPAGRIRRSKERKGMSAHPDHPERSPLCTRTLPWASRLAAGARAPALVAPSVVGTSKDISRPLLQTVADIAGRSSSEVESLGRPLARNLNIIHHLRRHPRRRPRRRRSGHVEVVGR